MKNIFLGLSLILSGLLFTSTPVNGSPQTIEISTSDDYCARWRSWNYNACEHEVRVDNNCYNRVSFRITASDGRYSDYYVNAGAWMTVPISYCGQWYFRWL